MVFCFFTFHYKVTSMNSITQTNQVTHKPPRVMLLSVVFGMMWSAVGYAADVNVASPFQLEATRGIGQHMAERIIAERTAHGVFTSWEDFSTRVKGVGDKKLKIMQDDGLTLVVQGNHK